MFSRDTLDKAVQVFKDKHLEIQGRLFKERRGDRANVSAAWNKYVKELNGTIIRGKRHGGPSVGYHAGLVTEMQDLINFKNERVSGSVILPNPDRAYQFMLIPRDVVDVALVLGLP
jgi:hypothetical protein